MQGCPTAESRRPRGKTSTLMSRLSAYRLGARYGLGFGAGPALADALALAPALAEACALALPDVTGGAAAAGAVNRTLPNLDAR